MWGAWSGGGMVLFMEAAVRDLLSSGVGVSVRLLGCWWRIRSSSRCRRQLWRCDGVDRNEWIWRCMGGERWVWGTRCGCKVEEGGGEEQGCDGVEKGHDITFVAVHLPCFGRIPFQSAPVLDNKHDCYSVGLESRLWVSCGERQCGGGG